MTTPKRPRTILAVEAELSARACNAPVGENQRVKLALATEWLANSNREIEKLEAENTLLKLQRARRRVGVSR